MKIDNLIGQENNEWASRVRWLVRNEPLGFRAMSSNSTSDFTACSSVFVFVWKWVCKGMISYVFLCTAGISVALFSLYVIFWSRYRIQCRYFGVLWELIELLTWVNNPLAPQRPVRPVSLKSSSFEFVQIVDENWRGNRKSTGSWCKCDFTYLYSRYGKSSNQELFWLHIEWSTCTQVMHSCKQKLYFLPFCQNFNAFFIILQAVNAMVFECCLILISWLLFDRFVSCYGTIHRNISFTPVGRPSELGVCQTGNPKRQE